MGIDMTYNDIVFLVNFQYKYQVSLDGTVAAYRLPYLLAGNSLLLKQDSNYYEFFYQNLQPWIHYVPFKSDLSDLLEKILWAKDHEDEVQRMISRARAFAREHLLPHHVLCYHAVMLKVHDPPDLFLSFSSIRHCCSFHVFRKISNCPHNILFIYF